MQNPRTGNNRSAGLSAAGRFNVPTSSRQSHVFVRIDFWVMFNISAVSWIAVLQAAPISCGLAGLAGFFEYSALMISRMNSTASWAFL